MHKVLTEQVITPEVRRGSEMDSETGQRGLTGELYIKRELMI